MGALEDLYNQTEGRPPNGESQTQTEDLSPLASLYREKRSEDIAASSQMPKEGIVQKVKDIGLSIPLGGDVTVDEGLQVMKQQALDIFKIHPVAEAGTSIATSLASMVPAGLAGAGAAVAELFREGGQPATAGAEVAADVGEKLTYTPKSEAGQRLAGQIAAPLEAYGQLSKDVAFEVGQAREKSIQAQGGTTEEAQKYGATAATLTETAMQILPFERVARGLKGPERPLTTAEIEAARAKIDAIPEAPAAEARPEPQQPAGATVTPTEPVTPSTLEPSPRTAEILAREEAGAAAETGPLPPPSGPKDEFTSAVAEMAAATKALEAIDTEDARVAALMARPIEEPTPEARQLTEWEELQKDVIPSEKVAENVARYIPDSPAEKIPLAELPIVEAVGAGSRTATKGLEAEPRQLQQIGELPAGTYVAGPESSLFPRYWTRAAAQAVERIRKELMPDAKIAIVGQLARDAAGEPKPSALGWSRRGGNLSYLIGPRHLLFFDEIQAGPTRMRNFAGMGIMSKFGKYNEVAQIQALYNLYHETGHALLNYYTDKTIGGTRASQLFEASRKGLIDEATIAELPTEFQPVVREFNRLKQGVMDGTMSLRQWLEEAAGVWRNAELTYLQRSLTKQGLRLDIEAPGSAKVYFEHLRGVRGKDYELSLPEYISEQTSRFGHQRNWERGGNLGTNRFFKGALDLMRKYFAILKKEHVLAPHTTFVDWLDSFGRLKQQAAPEMVAKPLVEALKGPKEKRAKVSKAVKEKMVEAGAPPEVLTPDQEQQILREDQGYQSWLDKLEKQPYPPQFDSAQTVPDAIEEARARNVPIAGLTEAEHAKNLRKEVLKMATETGQTVKDPMIKELFDMVKDGQHGEVASRLSEFFGKSIEYDDLYEAATHYPAGKLAWDLRYGDQVQLTGRTVAGEDGLWIEATQGDGSTHWHMRDALALEDRVPGERVDPIATITAMNKAPALKKPFITQQEFEAILKNPQFKAFDRQALRYAATHAPAEKGKINTAKLKEGLQRVLVPFKVTKMTEFATAGFEQASRHLSEGTLGAHPFYESSQTAEFLASRGDFTKERVTDFYAKRFTPDLPSVLQKGAEGLNTALGFGHVSNTRIPGAAGAIGHVRALFRDVVLREGGPKVQVAVLGELQSDVLQKANRWLREKGREDLPYIFTLGREALQEVINDGRIYAEELRKIDPTAKSYWDELTAVEERMHVTNMRYGDTFRLATAFDEMMPKEERLAAVQELRQWAESVGRVEEVGSAPDWAGQFWAKRKKMELLKNIEIDKLRKEMEKDPRFPYTLRSNAVYKDFFAAEQEMMVQYAEDALQLAEYGTKEGILSVEASGLEAYKDLSSNPSITLLDRAIVDMKAERPGLRGVMIGPREWLTAIEGWTGMDPIPTAAKAVLDNHERFRKEVMKRYPNAAKLEGDWIYIDVTDPVHEVFYDELDLSPTSKMSQAWKSLGEGEKDEFSALTRLKMGYFQLQQIAHLYPNIKELQFASAANSKYNRTKGALQLPAEKVAERWMNFRLAKEMRDKLGHALQREYEEGVHWTTLQEVPRKDGTPGTEWEHVLTDRATEELKKNGIDISTPAGQEAAQLFVDAKNALLHQMNYLERVLVKIYDRAGKNTNEARLLMKEYREMPFFPQTRFGHYRLEVSDGKKVVLRQAFESKGEWEEARARLAKGRKTGEKLRDFIVDEKKGHLSTVPNEFVDAMSVALDLTDEQVSEVSSLMDSFRSIKALKPYDRAQARVRGADPDALRRFVSFAWHNANLIAKMETNSHFRTALRRLDATERLLSTYRPGDLPTKDIAKVREGIAIAKSAIESTRDYLMYPPDEAQALRATMTGVFLAANVKAALVNLTGYVMTVADLMARLGPAKGLYKATEGTVRFGEALTGKLPPELKKAYDQAIRENVLDQSYAYHLANIANAGTLDRMIANNGMAKQLRLKGFDSTMWLFRVVEKATRSMTFLQEFDVLQKSGMSYEAAYKEAVRLTDLLQNNYSFGNRPPWMRGTKTPEGGWRAKIAGGTVPSLTLFMSWMQHASFHAFGGYEIGMRRRASLNTIKKPGSYTAYFALLSAAMAGYMGMPGAEDLLEIAQTAGRKIFERDVKKDLRELVKDMGGNPTLWAHGLTHNIPLGFGSYDVSGSVGLGRMVPGLDVATGTEQPTLDKMLASVPAGALFKWVTESLWGFAAGKKSFRDVSLRAPGSLGNLATAYDWWAKNGFYDLNGRKLLDREPTGPDIMMRALGFRPSDLTLAQEMNWEQLSMQMYWQSKRVKLLDQYGDAILIHKDREGIKDVKDAIKKYNQSVPRPEFKIQDSELKKSIDAKRRGLKTKEEFGVTIKRYRGEAGSIEKSFEPPKD